MLENDGVTKRRGDVAPHGVAHQSNGRLENNPIGFGEQKVPE
jgi:hypothetical protein